jgi:hypothetical protein
MRTRHWMVPFIITLATANGWAQAEGRRIQKWVDEKGVTHYGDRVPVQYAGQKSVEITSQGVPIKRKTPLANPKDKQVAESGQLNEQERRDRALLNSFTTEKEIDLARDRNLQMDEVAMQSLKLRLGNAEQRLEKTNATITDFIQKNKPVPADLTETQTQQQAEVRKIREQMRQKEASMEATRQRFDHDKQRFIELKSGSAPEGTTLAQPAP